MRRFSDKNARKKNAFWAILGIAFILMGILEFLLPFKPSIPYEEYLEKDIVISKFDRSYGARAITTYDYIITGDGENYTLTGDYDQSELSKILIKGTDATIKYRVNSVLPFLKYAEEIIVDGNKVATYDNDAPVNWTFVIIMGVVSCAMGAFFLFMYHWSIAHNRKLQEKRDKRIIKKYGSLEKD